MRFTQIIAAAVLAAPLALAVPVSTPVTPATADLNSDLTTSLHYVAALRQIKEKYPELAQEDANIAARGYLEAVGVQRAGGFSNSTALAERDMNKRGCCSNCDDCFGAIFTLGACCIPGGWRWKTVMVPIPTATSKVIL
ncbi:uncharacterized protein TrAtP1_002364 [Trichoderma atroviride]|uniref:uncharacterized protein n=1 Tax=Hypocrea atroviridis TaxID=63577 RepID=UPI003330172B|nr:hypothetical protein TrAtP1_002364 [Trichoderma atroviride]